MTTLDIWHGVQSLVEWTIVGAVAYVLTWQYRQNRKNEIMKAGKKQAKRLERRQRQYDSGHKTNERRPGSNKK